MMNRLLGAITQFAGQDSLFVQQFAFYLIPIAIEAD